MDSPDSHRPLSTNQIEDALEKHVGAVLNSRRTAKETVAKLSTLKSSQQSFVLKWISTIAQSNLEMAFQFASHAPAAFAHLDEAGMEAWTIFAMDEYDSKGLMAGIQVWERATEFADKYKQSINGLPLADIRNVLEHFVQGLGGRKLKIESSEPSYTDSETIFLPPIINQFENDDENFSLYKAMATHCWAQTWYRTWDLDIDNLLLFNQQPKQTLDWFYALETTRLNFRIARDLPGLGRTLSELSTCIDTPLPADWNTLSRSLRTEKCQAIDSWKLALSMCDRTPPTPRCYQGVIKPKEVNKIRTLRIKKEKDNLHKMLAQSIDEPISTNETNPLRGLDKFYLSFLADSMKSDFTLQHGGKPIQASEEISETITSILQDLGEVPDDYLIVPETYRYDATQTKREQACKDNMLEDELKDDVFIYNEWDHARQHYRKNWCILREHEISPRYDDFTSQTLIKYRSALKSLRASFEALRTENKRLRKQPYGDDIDIDTVVESFADRSVGHEVSNNLFTKADQVERNIAVMLMVDMSGSTKGWINTAERESLILLCEALETLGDRYAIYGFSGKTRKRCELYRIKQFSERYDQEIQARISGITPREYTRMGVAIRHLSTLLENVDARHKLLITLSDGKPDDYMGYRGKYGIEDTRQALFEVRQRGIHPFCITIDTAAEDYLPYMYGPANYAVVDDVRKLPLKVSAVYRKLTS